MKNLIEYILEAKKPSKNKIDRRKKILDLLYNSNIIKNYVRDETANDCPEMHGYYTVYVLKQRESQYDILNICLQNISQDEAINKLKKAGITIKETSFEEGECIKDDFTFKYRLSSQTYNSNPGKGKRGTSSNNNGISFEMNMQKNPLPLIKLLRNIIGDNEDKLSIINKVDPKTNVVMVGTTQTKTGVPINDKFFTNDNNFISYENQKNNFSNAIADIMVGSLPISLKYHADKSSPTTLANLGFGKEKTLNKYDKIYSFFKNLILDNNICEKTILPALQDFFTKNFDKDSWKEYKNNNKKINNKIQLDINQLNIDNIIKLLKFAWRGGYYYIVGENENNKKILWGFYVNDDSIKTLTETIESATLSLPYTSKEIFLIIKLKNGLTYKISSRDRNKGFNPKTPEIITPKELTYNKAEELKLTGISKIEY